MTVDENLFSSLEWRSIGPHRAGRVSAVAGHPTEKAVFYFGGVAGGVWKTIDAGQHWFNISDGYLNTAAIGSIAVSQSDPNVIYIGTGETNIRSNVSHGDGVYKSTDGGETWKNVGLKETRHIGRVRIHPTNPDIVYAAALGHAWGENEERGVFRSLDGGENWEKVLYKSPRAGSHDISIDPNNPRIIYAAIWQGQRYPHAASSGGEDSGLWKSTDGGDTWEDITRNPGLPTGILGKIGVAVSPARSGRVWALVEAEDGAMFRSDDHGATWVRLCEDMDLRARAWYYTHVYADPNDADTVWVLNMPCKKSVDGGKTFFDVPTPHGDNQDLWIDPEDSNRMIEGNDGGAAVTFNGGVSWSTNLNQPTAQFYHVTTDNEVPYNVYGSQQDNWAMKVPSMDLNGSISWNSQIEPGGGESGYIAIKPTEPYTVFGGGIGTGPGHGRLRAWNPRTRQARNVTVWPEVHGFGAGTIDHKYRFQWTFPIEFSPHDPDVLYVCSNHVHKSTDEGHSWEVISPDLTRNDPSKLGPSGGPITLDNSGAEIYCTIFAFKESAHEQGVFWAGSDDGLIHISRDGSGSWENITPPDLPEWTMINIIELSPHEAGKAYVAATGYKQDDHAPYLYKTSDYGKTWTKIVNGIPGDEFTRVVREDPTKPGLLYCGTEVGLHVSFDDGANWQRMQSNLPVCPIWDLVVKDNDLVVATHGRAFWILDDITPLHRIQDGLGDSNAVLFQPRDTPRFKYNTRDWTSPGENFNYIATGPVTVVYRTVKDRYGNPKKQLLNAGQNPPDGVIIQYYLKEQTEDEVKLEFLLDGEVVSSTSSKDDSYVGTLAGANRYIWNMRFDGPTPLKSATTNRRAAMMAAAQAPRAKPGTYEVRLTVGDTVETQTFQVLKDPRLDVTEADLEAQFNLKLRIRDRISDINVAVNNLRDLRSQIEAWEARTSDNEEIAAAGKAAREKLDAIENMLVVVQGDTPRSSPARLADKLATLSSMIEESDHAPTTQAEQVYDELSARVTEQTDALQATISNEIAAFNAKVTEAGLPPVSL